MRRRIGDGRWKTKRCWGDVVYTPPNGWFRGEQLDGRKKGVRGSPMQNSPRLVEPSSLPRFLLKEHKNGCRACCDDEDKDEPS